MATLPASAIANPVEQIARNPRVVQALDWLQSSGDWVTEQQIRITEIPAPEFGEKARGAYVGKLLEACGLRLRTDSVGNVIGELAGNRDSDVVLLVAHLDTVFPAGTSVRVRRQGSRLEAPGIADDGAGLAALVAVARALGEARIRPRMSLVFAADVGEEGEGNLRGIRQLIDAYRNRLRAVIAIDGAATDYVTTVALASHRVEIIVEGPGGHSWSDFGTPNPITALARGISSFSSIRPPEDPRTTFNFGVIQGGTSINSIPERASVKVDLRSESEAELARLELRVRAAFEKAVQDEMSASNPGQGALNLRFWPLGDRPAGKLPPNSALFAAISNVDRYLGNRTREERSSTDANLPLSLGIPAIAIGGGGQGGGSHSLSEWYDPAGRELGLKRILLTALAVAGVQP